MEVKMNDFDNERKQAFLDLKKQRDEKMKDILEDIEDEVEKYAKKHKIRVVLKKAAVAYGNKKLDKTQDIIKLLNKKK